MKLLKAKQGALRDVGPRSPPRWLASTPSQSPVCTSFRGHTRIPPPARRDAGGCPAHPGKASARATDNSQVLPRSDGRRNGYGIDTLLSLTWQLGFSLQRLCSHPIALQKTGGESQSKVTRPKKRGPEGRAVAKGTFGQSLLLRERV